MTTIALFLHFLLFLWVTVLAFAGTGSSSEGIFGKIRKKIKKLRIIAAVGFGILFLLDLTGIAPMSGYRFISVWGAALTLITSIDVSSVSEKFRGLAAFALRSLSVCMMFEVFVFNFNSAHIIDTKYETKTLDFSTAHFENFDPLFMSNYSQGMSLIEFKGINAPVGTLKIITDNGGYAVQRFGIDVKDDTYAADYRTGMAEANVIYGDERSQTVPLNFSGNVHDLRIYFFPEAGQYVNISAIEINAPIMFRFSILRFGIMFLGSLAVYALCSRKLLRRPYGERRGTFNLICYGFTAALVILSLCITNMSRYTDPEHSIANDFSRNYGDQISQEIVDAFEKGQTYLYELDESEFNYMENIYDWSWRDLADADDLPWDHLVYEGKVYSYYGIGPVLTLFLPYHAITGYYFPTIWAVWLFIALGIIFITAMWLELCKRFFRNIDGSMVILGLVMMQISTCALLNLHNPLFYEIAQSSAFLCVAAGAYFLVGSAVIGEGKIRYGRLIASGIWLSMAVLCRPTTAVYCVAAMFFIYAGYKKLREKNAAKGDSRKFPVKYFACALLPYVCIGLVQVWYNWARFGNPLDFGIQYSITINDFTRAEYHTHFVFITVISYVLAFPGFTPQFPFLTAEYPETFNPNGYYFVATGAAMGLLWKALPMLAYFKAPAAYRSSTSKNKRLYTLLILIVCIICPFIIMFSVWESGYGTRYSCDFAWQMILGALVICYFFYGRVGQETRRRLNTAMIAVTGVSIVMNLAQLYSYYPVTLFNKDCQAALTSFARLFEFWK